MNEEVMPDSERCVETRMAMPASRFIACIQKAIAGAKSEDLVYILKEAGEWNEQGYRFPKIMFEDQAIRLALEIGMGIQLVDDRLGLRPGNVILGNQKIESKHCGAMDNSLGDTMLIQFETIKKT